MNNVEPPLFYLQDSRSYVGNSVMFWAIGGGYTSDVSKASVWFKAAAQDQHACRPSDIPWLKEYIDARVQTTCDMQYLHRIEGVKAAGIVLHTDKPATKKVKQCSLCGCFLSITQIYAGKCPKCGGDNRP